MALSNRFLMGCASLSMVFAIGYIMENYAQSPAQAPVQTAKVEPPALPTNAPVELTGITLTAAPAVNNLALPPLTTEDPQIIRAAAGPEIPVAPTPDVLDEPTPSCEPVMSAKAMAGAVAEVHFQADCMPYRRVTVHHNGMMFTQLTDASGEMVLSVPVLSSAAVFIADAGQGAGAVAHVSVPDLALYDRAVAQWQGDKGLQLHALEFGANYNDVGHVSVATPGSQDLADQQGFVIELGDPTLPESYQAAVYTFPTGLSQKSGTVELSVEAEVTAANCNRDVLAETLQLNGGQGLVVHELTLAMPECDAIGDFLLLNNLLQNLTIAAK
ncbi:MAG: hypothetical protein JXR13_15795 [Thalassovita sp.]